MKISKVATQTELEQTFNLRKLVFVEEQEVPLEDEFDEFDALNTSCDHILVTVDDEPVGCGRIRVVDGVGKLERIVVKKEFRGQGLGNEIVISLEIIAKEKGLKQVKLHGQTHAEKFYTKLDYQVASDVFLEDGIEHVVMKKKL